MHFTRIVLCVCVCSPEREVKMCKCLMGVQIAALIYGVTPSVSSWDLQIIERKMVCKVE